MSAALERVIEEQQARIDRYESQEKRQTEWARSEFVRYRTLFDALQFYMGEVERHIFPHKAVPFEFDRERYLRLRETLRKAAEDAGYCWRCENYGCVCSDCECD